MPCVLCLGFSISPQPTQTHTAHSEALPGTLSPHEGHMVLEDSQDATDPPKGAQGDLQNVTEK